MRVTLCLVAAACLCCLFISSDRASAGDTLATRRLDDIKKALAEINAPLDKSLEPVARERQLALQRLRTYRYLAGIAYRDLELDDDMNRYAVAAALLCQKLGRLDHNPKNPGLPEDEFKTALKGTRSSNLGVGYTALPQAVDGWMNDSDATNIDRLGHRRWCLNPAMQKVGLGRAGKFFAMYCFDASRRVVADFDYISWPPAGLMPVEYIRAGHAWNISLNPKKYKAANQDATVKIEVLDKAGNQTGKVLQLSYKNVNTDAFGIGNCVIFRPAGIEVVPGKRFAVTIEGLETLGGEPAAVSFKVEFCKS
jgi:hypothetical protein